MPRLRRVLWAVVLLAPVVVLLVWVVPVGLPGVGLPEVPAGYVACEDDPVYDMNKAEPYCDTPGPDTPKKLVLYCPGTRTDFDSDSCYYPGLGS